MLSKIAGEYLINYSKLNFVVFRPHNIFGPDMGFSHVIPQLTKKIYHQNKRNVIINNSTHKRTFCFIDFAIDLILKISHSKKSSKKIFNIGSPDKEITIMNLAKKIKKILKSENKLLDSKLLKDNSPVKRRPDMKKSLKFTKLKHNFDEGLIKTVMWYKRYYVIDMKLSTPHIIKSDVNAINKVLKSGWISTSSGEVYNFEKKLSSFCKTKYSVALNSGTSAIHLGLKILGVKNCEVIVPSLTFIATVNPILYLGADPLILMLIKITI